MSGWDYEDVGEFGSKRQAEDWARRNNIDPRDLHVREGADGSADTAVKRSAGKGGDRYNDSHGDRKNGFF